MKINKIKIKYYFFFFGILFCFPIYGQTVLNIKGTVSDAKLGGSLPSVSILIKGTPKSTSTDFDGNYSISAKTDDILVFSYMGYKTIEMPIDGKTNINISLDPENNVLNEIIVVGYGTQKKSDVTGAVVRADLATFREQGNTNILQSLQGSVVGLNVGVSTSAGGNLNVSLRGKNNLGGSGVSDTPLIVVDGIIFRGTLQDINPDDVQSVDVLKDASSTAIYGSEASNGVILIATKSGKGSEEGKPVFNYSTRYSIKEDAHKLEYGSGEDYLNQIRAYNWRSAFPQGDLYNPNFNPITGLDPAEVKGYNNGTNFNWQDLLTQKGFVNNHNLSISGNAKNVTYFISGSFLDEEEIIIGDNYEKITGRINLDVKLNDWWKIGTNSFVTTADYSGIEFDRESYTYSPYASPYDDNGNLISSPTGRLQSNPLLAASDIDADKRLHLNTTLYTTFDVPWIKGLSYRLNYNNSYRTRRHNQFLYKTDALPSRARKNFFLENDWTMDHILSYNTTIKEVHNVNATLVYGREERSIESTEVSGSNFSNQTLGFNDFSLAGTKVIESGAEDESSIYQMARLNYNFDKKYFVTGTVRRDGFSGFGTLNKFAVFPSVALGWTLSKENFFKGLDKTMSNLKLRASYGESGKRGVGRYETLARVAQNNAYVFGDGGTTASGQEVSTIASPNLKWETTNGVNLGLDFGLLNNRITGNIEYYNTDTKDILVGIDIPSLNGFSKARANLGKVHNTGFEFTVNSRNMTVGDFEWSSTVNFSTNKNKIVSVLGRDDNEDGKEDDLPTAGLFIGKELGAIYHFQIDPNNPIYQIGDPLLPGFQTGFYRLVDQNKDGKITSTDDKVILGSKDPAYRFSIVNTFTYKNFKLSAFINAIQGGKNKYLGEDNYWRVSNWDAGGKGKIQGLLPKVVDYWTPDNPNAEYPVISYGGINNPSEAIFLRDRSFVRLQDVSLSYSFDEALIKKMGLKHLTLVASGKNLATWTKWKGVDPEATDDLGNPVGISFGRPVIRSYTFGVNLSF
ncbi:SusC/RagA family TonB-linked outer membrane protein [Flavobacterium sp. XS2P39]|uniref:SusC/RagA family TonB-linked outer membrane protein n=1 Tax=Flavobacterium sp. XS2P39 TaxID=3401725 RepID=UPI003AAB29C5